jgi:hypothetical protein
MRLLGLHEPVFVSHDGKEGKRRRRLEATDCLKMTLGTA